MQPPSVVNSPAQPPSRNADSQLPTIQSQSWNRYSDRSRKNSPPAFHRVTSPATNWLRTRSVWPASSARSYGFKNLESQYGKITKGTKREKSHAKSQRRKGETKYGIAERERIERKERTANEHETEDKLTADGRGFTQIKTGIQSKTTSRLRPVSPFSYVGQEAAKENLAITVHAACPPSA